MHAICRAQMHREIGIPCDIDTTRLPCPKIGRCSDKRVTRLRKKRNFRSCKKKKERTRFEIVIGLYRFTERWKLNVTLAMRNFSCAGKRSEIPPFFNWPPDNYRIPARLSQLLLNYASRFNPVGLHFSRLLSPARSS